MAAQNQGGPNMEQFENYFKRADLDGDGKISGNEAVTFFQGSNLPKPVLAQIWMHADQARTGFLGRAEFFNALRLVTVAQSKRELTPEIVKAALYGPAAAKIPPPQINLPPAPAPQSNSIVAATSPAMRSVSPMQSQNVGIRGQTPLGNNQQSFSSQQSQSVRPSQPLFGGSSFQPQQQVNTGPRGSSMGSPSGPVNNNWIGGSGAMGGPRGVNPPAVSASATQQYPASLLSLSPSDSKAMVVSGNGSASASTSASDLGGDLFSANAPQSKQSPSLLGYSASSTTVSASASVGPQSSVKTSALDSLQSSFSMQSASSQVQRPQTPQMPVSAQGPSSFSLTGALVATANSSPNNSQIPWPKMKASDVQKYTKVFMEVDTDRDGKITGEQARNLFLSWRLPREVLKQVWDLSDQDSDSMLSLREFCFALYLMERYREGRPLPASLPSNVMYDETLLSMTGPSNATYGNAAWGPGSGFGPQGMPGAQPLGPATGVRPPMQGPVPPANSAKQLNQPGLPALERGDSFTNQVDHIESYVANSNVEEASASEKKVQEKVEEKVILDSREKLEFYRTKMQDLVLYKRRCDNRLNEIIERASTDKREAETLMKKYEEKYKQVAEIASKVTIEEASFREIQERKSELQQAIVKMEQGGSADGILQVRADRIQSDLDELLKAFAGRCKKHGIEVRSKALIVLPTGWQPGIPELAAVWDEDWDKFEDEGFSTEITVDGKNITTSPTSVHASPDNGFAHDSPLSADGKVSHSPRTSEHAFDSESAYAQSEDEVARSPRGSPLGRMDGESPSNIFSNTHFDKASEADPDIHRNFDDSNWGAFDNDDVDSVWGFNTKDPDSSFNRRDSFGPSDFGVNPIRTSSTLTDNAFQNRTSFFDESVPATPMSNFGNSSPRYSEAGDHYFDNNFSRFDSFRTNDSGFYAQPEKLARFDSISSSKDVGHSRAFTSFDESDPFGSSGPFKVSSDNQTPKKSSDNWSAF